jgi:cation transport ATPase
MYVMRQPGAFSLRVLRAFRANQALLLSGAVAYYTLLSIVPLLILILIALSAIIDQGALLATLGRYLEARAKADAGAAVRSGLAPAPERAVRRAGMRWEPVAVALVVEELIFGQVFRVFFTAQPVQVKASQQR